MNHARAASFLGMLLLRGALLATLWWMLAGPAAWGFGVVVILLALGSSLVLQPERRLRLRPLALLRFAGFFVHRSLRAGTDVALRALSPQMALAPALIDCRLRLRLESSRVFLANTLSLLPGSLSVDLRGDLLRIHVLDVGSNIEHELRAVETRIAALFGEALEDPPAAITVVVDSGDATGLRSG